MRDLHRTKIVVSMVSAFLLFIMMSCGGGGSSSSRDTFSVGGTVTGLSGTLVVQNNGGDDLNINADGSFTFTSDLDDSATYNVTILTQPNGQTCSVSTGSGTISAADVNNVSISCSNIPVTGWSHPTGISDAIETPGVEPFGFQVALANNGDAVLAYYDLDDQGNGGVFKAERRSGTWTYPANMADDMGNFDQAEFRVDHYDPIARISMSDTGETLITWVQYADFDGTAIVGDSVYKAEYRDNGSGVFNWTYPSDLADHLNWGYGKMHEMGDSALNASGEAIVAWAQSTNSGNPGVYKAEFFDSTWTFAENSLDVISPNANVYPTTRMPNVAINDDGDAIIVWSQRYNYYTPDYRIMISEYDRSSDTWAHPATISDNVNPTPGDARLPKVVLSNNGDAIVAWHQDAKIYIAHYTTAGGWVLPAADEEIFDGSSDPQVAMDDNGNAIIVWSATDGTNKRIYMTEYRNGNWTTPEPISTTGSDTAFPQVAMSGNGEAVVLWRQYVLQGSTNYNQLFIREYRNDTWSAMPGLDEYISLDINIGDEVSFSSDNRPHLTMNDNGDTLIIWKQYDVANNNAELIFMSEFNH
ncbi:MAG: hypothetical protein RQ754_08190 [Desulfuromonadales bacterium]|nr:hypothetical protein [Desulfuromonadales bacterium]